MEPAPHRLALVIENMKLDAIGKNGVVPNSASDEGHIFFALVRSYDNHVIGLKQFYFVQESSPLALNDAMIASTSSFASAMPHPFSSR